VRFWRGDQPILPSQGQRIAHSSAAELFGRSNVYTDNDDILRRLPAHILDRRRTRAVNGPRNFLCERLNSKAEFGQDGAIALAGYRIPGPGCRTQ